MAITATDIKFYLTGGASNSDVNASLGGAVSSTEITDNSLHNLFDKVTGAESTAGDTEYRCIAIKNTRGSLTLQSAIVYISSETSHSGANIQIALAGEGLNTQPETVANENTAPSGETFSESASEGAALSLGNIPNGQYYAIWLKRIIGSSTAAKDNYTTVLTVKGDTSE